MSRERSTPSPSEDDPSRIGPCPQCGKPMNLTRGLKGTICPACGFKDACCY